jgi:hypothetical protein
MIEPTDNWNFHHGSTISRKPSAASPAIYMPMRCSISRSPVNWWWRRWRARGRSGGSMKSSAFWTKGLDPGWDVDLRMFDLFNSFSVRSNSFPLSRTGMSVFIRSACCDLALGHRAEKIHYPMRIITGNIVGLLDRRFMLDHLHRLARFLDVFRRHVTIMRNRNDIERDADGTAT